MQNTSYLLKDVRALSALDLEPVSILDAGFPCQSFSQAGSRKGFDDERGKLFYELMRVIREFKDKRPSVIIFENSPNLRHGEGGRWFLEVSKEIKKAGYWFRETSFSELDPFELTPNIWLEMNVFGRF
jgi:DNA (cytosine-5)-methyltransferase 1